MKSTNIFIFLFCSAFLSLKSEVIKENKELSSKYNQDIKYNAEALKDCTAINFYKTPATIQIQKGSKLHIKIEGGELMVEKDGKLYSIPEEFIMPINSGDLDQKNVKLPTVIASSPTAVVASTPVAAQSSPQASPISTTIPADPNSQSSSNSEKAPLNSTGSFSEKPGQSYKLIGPKVKGLSIGMRFQDAIAIISQKVKGKKDKYGKEIVISGPFKAEEGPIGGIVALNNSLGADKITGSYIQIGGLNSNIIRAGDDNAVYFINLPSDLFDNTSDLSFNEFAKKFMDSYGIIELNPSENGHDLVYKDPDGVSVKIFSDDRTILIEKVATEKQINASFD